MWVGGRGAGGKQSPLLQKRRYLDSNQHILRILDDYPNRQGIDYLRSTAITLDCKFLVVLTSTSTAQKMKFSIKN